MSPNVALQIELAAGKSPPTEFRLFTKGNVETTKGTFLFDDLAAATVIANAQDWGNEFPLDYDHAMVRWDAPADGGIAAGWFKPELRDGELWATNVSWTPKATKHLTDREYRYCSPTFRVDDNRRITQLINCALTNLPATKRMDPLVASQRPHGHQSEAAPPTSPETTMSKLFLIALGLPETTPEAEAVARASRMRELVSLTGKGTPDEAFGVVLAWKKAFDELPELVKKVAALEAAAQDRDITLAIDEATKQGKVTPAQRESLLALGKSNPTSLKTFLDAAPTLSAAAPAANEKPAAKPAPSPDQVKLAQQLGVKPEDLV